MLLPLAQIQEMGVSSSKVEEDKALKLCSERKKFVKQALDGRCFLASSHVTYIQSLQSLGMTLRRFVEPDPPTDSSLCTSTSATPEPPVLNDKSPSHFSFNSGNFSPSPPLSSGFQVNQMKFKGSFSRTIEEKPSLPIMGRVKSSGMSGNTPQNTTTDSPLFETEPSKEPSNPPWDYFFPSTENDLSFQKGKSVKQQFDNSFGDEQIPVFEEDKSSLSSSEDSCESEDEFDEPSANTLVRSFENLNREKSAASEPEILIHMKPQSPVASPSQVTPLAASAPTNSNSTPVKEYVGENKISFEDFFSTMKYIEDLFNKASMSGKEVPRMLEANKLHFRPVVSRSEGGGSAASKIFKACCSCSEDPSKVPEEPDQAAGMKYLTWHRTASSSRSASSRMLNGSNSKDVLEDPNSHIPDNFCMISGSHASTLDRLYAWERKLYDEVKCSRVVRKKYDMKCRSLRQLESAGESSQKIDKLRAVIKDLHSQIQVAIHRIDHISSKIEELRDKELQPQLEELIKGLSDMWKDMSKYHKLQYNAILLVQGSGNPRMCIHSESRRQITARLENELGSLCSSFSKWMGAQKSYLQSIDGWLLKCYSPPHNPKRRSNFQHSNSWKNNGPPIYITCDVWLQKMDGLPTKDVADSIKGLGSETSRFLPRHEKDARGVFRDEVSEEYGLDQFKSSLVGFLGQLNVFAESCAEMYRDVGVKIEGAKARHREILEAHSLKRNSHAKANQNGKVT